MECFYRIGTHLARTNHNLKTTRYLTKTQVRFKSPFIIPNHINLDGKLDEMFDVAHNDHSNSTTLIVQNSRDSPMTMCGIILQATIPMKQNVAIRIDPMATKPYASIIASLGEHNRLAIPICTFQKKRKDVNIHQKNC
jgi:hypothetical protein